MKGFRYVNDSAELPSCTKLADEICNGGPLAWEELIPALRLCPRPCKYTSYTHSQIESFESNYVEKNPNQVHLSLKANRIKRIETEILIYDVLDMIGALGGSLGLYLGFSFFDLISKCIDNFIDYVSKNMFV